MTPFEQARKNAGLSVKQCAKLLSVHHTTVRRWELNRAASTAKDAPPLALRVIDWYTRKVPPEID